MSLRSQATEVLCPVALFVAVTGCSAAVLVALERNAELQRLHDAAAQWDALNAAASTANLTELRALYQASLGARPVVEVRDWTFIGVCACPRANIVPMRARSTHCNEACYKGLALLGFA